MDDELVQEIRPLRLSGGAAPGRRALIAALGWMAALVALVAVGVLGPRDASSGPIDGARIGLATEATPDDAADTAADAPATPRPLRVAILEPAGPDPTITTLRLGVRGFLAAPVRSIEVRLESRGQHMLEVFAYRPDVAPRAGQRIPFATDFDLPVLRPNGTMWVLVVGYNERGIPVDATRRRVVIGELLEDVTVPGGGPRPGPGVRPGWPTAGYAV